MRSTSEATLVREQSEAKSSLKRRRPASLDFSSLIVILVGKDKTACSVPFDALASTPYFKHIMDRSKRISTNHDGKPITLEATTLEDFNAYINWLMDGEVPEVLTLSESYETFCRLWILGDLLGNATFCNRMLDALLERRSTERTRDGMVFPPPVNAVNYVWTNAAENSELKKLFLVMCTCWTLFSKEDMLLNCQTFRDDLLLFMLKNPGRHFVTDD